MVIDLCIFLSWFRLEDCFTGESDIMEYELLDGS